MIFLMLIKEKDRIIVPIQIRKADSFLQRLRGLMFRRHPLDQEGLWIIPCQSIHMFFMHFAIDAIFMDKHQRIVKLVENLAPGSMIPPVSSAYSVLEIPAGTVQRYGFETGDLIEIE